MESNHSDGCVFCSRKGQPPTLFETHFLYVTPDKFPLLPGHLLIISKRHLRCYGEASMEVLRELDQTVPRLQAFLTEMYRPTVLVAENGVSGQSVFHAHLHLIPVGSLEFPDEMTADPDVVRITDWEQVRNRFAQHGNYRYLELSTQRYLLPGYSAVFQEMLRLVELTNGLTRKNGEWLKTTSVQDVEDAARRWQKWANRNVD